MKEMVLRPWILLERAWATDNRSERSEININIRWAAAVLARVVTLLGSESAGEFGPHD